jgi:acyl-phosphate glycerol 3-phosphate acyltransferase
MARSAASRQVCLDDIAPQARGQVISEGSTSRERIPRAQLQREDRAELCVPFRRAYDNRRPTSHLPHVPDAVMLTLGLLSLASYLLGAIPFGWLVARSRGIDILRHGSGNIGATNVGRVLGKKYGILVLALDFAKGALPVAIAKLLPAGDVPREALTVAAGIAAFLGHLFPVYLKFRGGKGVATGAGVVVVLVPLPALAAIATWVVVVVVTRYVSVASVCAAATLCATHLAVAPWPWAWPHSIVSVFCLVAAALVGVRHAGNLRRLAAGTENRLKEFPAMMLLSKTLHVLSLGLWFGSAAFFTLAGSLMFDEFKAESRVPADQRPLWFPLPKELAKDPPSPRFPTPLAEEQGSRAFGVAVRPLFPWYYGIQLVCALVAYGTALSWQRGRENDRAQRWRTLLLMLALVVTAVGWWMEGKVNDLRGTRDRQTDIVVQAQNPTPEQIATAETERREFVQWHLGSLAQNFVTLVLVTIAMALAAQLPAATTGQPATASDEKKAASDHQTPVAV